jgi:hypothetical protein
VDGHRRYADEPETPSWYSGAGAYESGVHERPSGAFRLPDQRVDSPYAASDPLSTSGSHAFTAEDSGSGRIPVRGPEYPTIRPSGGTSLADAPPASSTTYPPAATATTYSTTTSTTTFPASSPSTYPTSAAPGTYGSSAPASAVPAATEPTGVVPPIASTFGAAPEPVYRTRRPASAVVIAVVSLLLMVPVVLLLVRVTFIDDPSVRGVVPAVLLTMGLPLTGIGLYALAARGGPSGRDTWLRPPVAYLPVGLFLLLAAGLAVA